VNVEKGIYICVYKFVLRTSNLACLYMSEDKGALLSKQLSALA